MSERDEAVKCFYLLTTYKFSRRDVKDDIVSVPTRKCVYCLEEGTVQVIRRDWYEYLWENPRKTVQEHFPYLSRAYREQIISGTHPVCFAEMFGDGEWALQKKQILVGIATE